jgi:hypothetical protein
VDTGQDLSLRGRIEWLDRRDLELLSKQRAGQQKREDRSMFQFRK